MKAKLPIVCMALLAVPAILRAGVPAAAVGKTSDGARKFGDTKTVVLPGGEVQDNVWRLLRKGPFEAFQVADVQFACGETRGSLEHGGAVALELDVVVVAEIVYADDIPSAAQELARRVEADEAGETSYQHSHDAALYHNAPDML